MAEVVAEEFSDTTTALKQLSAAANAPIDKADRFVAVYLGWYNVINSHKLMHCVCAALLSHLSFASVIPHIRS